MIKLFEKPTLDDVRELIGNMLDERDRMHDDWHMSLVYLALSLVLFVALIAYNASLLIIPQFASFFMMWHYTDKARIALRERERAVLMLLTMAEEIGLGQDQLKEMITDARNARKHPAVQPD